MEKLLVPLDGKNWSTWRIQIRMLLINLGLWNIVQGTETEPVAAENNQALRSQFQSRRNKALSTIVLAVSPSLLYLLGEPEDPLLVWKKLEGHFQSSSWANHFAIRKRLYSMVMNDGTSVCQHIKNITELFDRLTAVGDTIKEKDRVIILLSSLPRKFDVLITALQSSKEMPSWGEVVEKLSAEEIRQGERSSTDEVTVLYAGKARHSGAKTSYDHGGVTGVQNNRVNKFKTKSYDIECFHCGKKGHMKKNCF